MNLKYTISECKQEAQKKGGDCLSEAYLGALLPMKWKCSCNHIWYVPFYEIKRGRWCKICADISRAKKRNKYTAQQVEEKAKERGFKLLSPFVGGSINYEWECPNGHTWKTSVHSIFAGLGCRKCNIKTLEEKTRFVFEELTGKRFPNKKRAINSYELDGYCDELKLAFEHHGQQHYKFVKYFHKNQETFQKRIEIDRIKTQICIEKGISKIDVPYFIAKDNTELISFIKNEFTKLNVSCVKENCDWTKFNFRKSKIDYFNEQIKHRNIKCTTLFYTNSHTPVDLECLKCGYKWKGNMNNVKKGSGCVKCKGVAPITEEDIFRVCRDKGIILISYVGSGRKSRLKVKCNKCFLEWETMFVSLRTTKGNGCHRCSGQERLTIKDVYNACNSKNVQFCDPEFKSANTFYNWKCNFCGKIWKTNLHRIRKKVRQGCNSCAKTKRLQK